MIIWQQHSYHVVLHVVKNWSQEAFPYCICGKIASWMNVLSWLFMLVLVLWLKYTTESSRAMHQRAHSLRISIVHQLFFCFLCLDYNLYFSWHFTSPTYIVVLSPPTIQVKGQNNGRGYCGCRSACGCISLCVCVHYAWVEAARRRRRCCREQKHFADVAGKKEWMESSVVISRTALSDSQRYATCGPIPIQSQFSICSWSHYWKSGGTKCEVFEGERKDQEAGRERGKEQEKFEKHVY